MQGAVEAQAAKKNNNIKAEPDRQGGETRRRGRPRIDQPDPIDRHVGKRIRARRTLLGWSQTRLGDALGLTFQQVQKYERGTNRVGASRLYQISEVLDVPVAYFFDGYDGDARDKDDRLAADADQSASAAGNDMERRETLELVRAYYRISDPSTRRKVLALVRSMASD